MGKKRRWPVTLEVNIAPEGLKQVVEDGRLLEFVDVFSTLAGQHIRAQLIEELAKAGTGVTDPGGGISIDVGFLLDEPYGTGPFPWPWPRGRFGSFTEYRLRQVVQEELSHRQ